MPKNIIVSALGASYEIIEETIGYINYNGVVDFYNESPSYGLIDESRTQAGFEYAQVDELWLVATDRKAYDSANGFHVNSVMEDFDAIKRDCSRYVETIRVFVLDGVDDIISEKDALYFRDLAFRVIAFARKQCEGGRLYLSLACGRKTMSADIQEAAYCFGCDALIHVLGNKKTDAYPLNLGKISQNEVLRGLKEVDFVNNEIVKSKPDVRFLDKVNRMKKEAQHFFTTYYLSEKETRSNFHILYTLPPSKIDKLKSEMLGVDSSKQDEELAYLKRLPKTDLHCHLGGVLSATEMIEVAKCYIPLIEEEKRKTTSLQNGVGHMIHLSISKIGIMDWQILWVCTKD